MFYFLSLLMGILISVMIAVNGGLTNEYGVYSATIIIHTVGLILITAAVRYKKERFFPGNIPWFLYLGGAIGVFTTVANNLSFGRISVSAILALGLLGQSVTGLVIDQFGLMGMPKHPFTKDKILGLTLILAGIASMINSFEILAVVVSFLAGFAIIMSRTLNAKLANVTSVSVSTFYNYFVGLIVAILVFALLGRGEIVLTEFALSPRWYIYLGGALGVTVVFLSNIVVVKISAFYLTLLIFVGQVFSGVLIDAFISQAISVRNIVGGVLVAVGLSINLVIDYKKPKESPKEA
ncbi:MAG: DMT family transporter [Defluviitaleaceae bacterium]|nr:DMT family transporter [Defluviitaleaceae bacterium]